MLDKEKYQMNLVEIRRMEESYPALARLDSEYPGEIDIEKLERDVLVSGIELEDLVDYYLLKHQLALHDFKNAEKSSKGNYSAEVLRTHNILGYLERYLNIAPVDNPLRK